MNIIQLGRFKALFPKDFGQLRKSYNEVLHQGTLSGDQLRDFRKAKLSSFLKHAKDNVPYWSEKMIAYSDKDILNAPVDVVSDLPVLTKDVFREEMDRMWASNIEKFHIATTGGTTGTPLVIHRDYNCDLITKAYLIRARHNWGLEPWDKAVHLFSFGKASLLGTIRMRLANKKIGDAFPSSETERKKNFELIETFKPKALEGFATGLLTSVDMEGKQMNTGIPVIISTGEMLYSHQREQLEEYFGGKVYTYYGSNEVGSIAFDNEDQKLEVNRDHVLFDTVNESGKSVRNEEGRVVVTDMDNYAMPFIKYELGDIAVLRDDKDLESQGRTIIHELLGRSQDFLSGQDGRRLQATQLWGFLKDLKDIGHIQFHQYDEDLITIKLDGKGEETERELEVVKSHLLERLGSVNIQIDRVDKIEKTKRGKQPLVIKKRPNS